MHMWYWAIMVLLILGSIALLCSTFISVKKNKAQDAERRKQSRNGKRNKADQGYDPEEDQPQGKKRRSSGQNGSMGSAKRSSKKEDSGRLSWKIWIHGRNIALYSMMKWESEEQRGMTIMRSICHCMRMEEYPSSIV